MLRAGCQPGALRSALGAGSRQSPAAQRAFLVAVCGGSSGAEDPSRLTPSRLPSLTSPSHHLLGERALATVSAPRQDLRSWGNQLGGTLIVDDSSHKEDVQKAVRNGTISFGFSAGGCLFPYYIGCAGALMDGGILTEGVKVGGASAGSLLAACLKSGIALDHLVEQNLRLMDDLRRGGTRGRLRSVLKTFLHDHLPEDAHERCSDRAYVAVTKITPIARPVLVSRFNDREDLIQALLTSCHIPFWMDGSAFTEFRGERHCDGGLTNFIPLPPQTVGIRVCCFPSKQLSPVYRIGISPDSFEPWDYTMRQMLQWAFEPADEAIVLALIDKGKRDTQAWMESMELTGEKQASEHAARQEVGAVAAAKEAAGTADTGEHAAAVEAGHEELQGRAQRGGAAEAATGAGGKAPAEAAPAAELREQQAAEPTGAPQQAAEAAARAMDAGADEQQQEEAAERALREAEEEEAAGGNIWARALGAAGVAASAAAVAAAVSGGLPL